MEVNNITETHSAVDLIFIHFIDQLQFIINIKFAIESKIMHRVRRWRWTLWVQR